LTRRALAFEVLLILEAESRGGMRI
jgi:hypothetical protein